jgi:hypothetical protein
LIVGIVHPCSRETVIGFANSFGAICPIGSFASASAFKQTFTQNEFAPTARYRAESASTPQRTAIPPISSRRLACTEVMHPKSISRELAQENEDRPGIA